MFFLTGDTHGVITDVEHTCRKLQLTEDDTLIILGDAGWNFYLDRRDNCSKKRLAALKPTFFCIHGNHECRPEHISSYNTKQYRGGLVWYEEAYPNCEKKQMEISFGDYGINIHTPYDDWIIVQTERKHLGLYHKNTKNIKGKKSPIKDYHFQDETYFEIKTLVRYIHDHDRYMRARIDNQKKKCKKQPDNN